ncbi:MAG: hypothetical protein DRI94_08320 [Bacteroidetes bacterium]|nr:MAG: hypothetical protein DRI94_08320 [Bacteroidota bacterium]
MKLVFLTYINRSGSSFLANNLSKQNEIFVLPEAELLLNEILITKENNLEKIKNIILAASISDNKFSNYNLSKKDIEDCFNGTNNKAEIFINIILRYKNINKPNAKIIIFKNRDIYSMYDIIQKQLDSIIDISVLCIIRDPRGVFYSQKTTVNPYTNKIMNNNPIVLSHLWNSFLQNLKKISKNKILVRFEDLLIDYNTEFNKILKKLQVSNTEDIGNPFFELISEKEKKIHVNITKKPNLSKSNNWKNLSNTDIKIIENITKRNMIENNYSLSKDERLGFFENIVAIYYKIRILLSIDNY